MSCVHVKKCQLCSFEAPDLKYLLKHIRQGHAHKPGFHIRCNLSGCPRVFRTFEVFRNHVYCFHTDHEHTVTPSCEQLPSDDNIIDTDETPLIDPKDVVSPIQKAAAIWILKIQEVYKIPQSTMEKILTDVTGFIQDILTDLYDEVISMLTTAGAPLSSLVGLAELFSHSSTYANPFAGLKNQSSQLKIYKKAFNLVVCSYKKN